MAERRACGEEVVDLLRDDKALVRIEAERLLDARHLVRAERRTVAVGRVLLGGRAVADVRRRDDEDRLASHLLRAHVDAVNRLRIVSVDLEDLPAVALEAQLRVVVHREGRVALDRDVVRIVDENEVVELHRTGPRADLVADALLKVAVAAEDPRAVARLRLLRRQREADAHRNALAERTRRHLDARHQAALGMPGAAAAPLAEGLELVHRKPADASEVEERVDERGGVSAREDETVAIRPGDILRINPEMVQPEDGRQVRHAHRRAGMPRIGLFNHVRAQAANRIRNQLHLISRNLHFVSPKMSVKMSVYYIKNRGRASPFESRRPSRPA